MKHIKLLMCSLIIFLPIQSASAESVLRITCDDISTGAKIYINNKYRARCPSDLFVSSRKISLRAVKQEGAEHVRVYEENFILEDNSAKRVEITLSAPRLTAAAVEKRRIRAAKDARVRVASKLKRDKAHADSVLVLAKKGDADAMVEMSRLYIKGVGLKVNRTKAFYWRNKGYRIIAAKVLLKAKNDDVAAMRTISTFYAQGKGVDVDHEKAVYWNAKADEYRAAEAKLAAEAREQAVKRAELDNFSYFNIYNKMFGHVREEDRFSAGSTMLSPTISLPLLVDTILLPTRTVQHQILKSQVASRPSIWGKPDSMIAKAYANRYVMN